MSANKPRPSRQSVSAVPKPPPPPPETVPPPAEATKEPPEPVSPSTTVVEEAKPSEKKAPPAPIKTQPPIGQSFHKMEQSLPPPPTPFFETDYLICNGMILLIGLLNIIIIVAIIMSSGKTFVEAFGKTRDKYDDTDTRK